MSSVRQFFARFESVIAFRLYVAVEMAKEMNPDKAIIHALRVIQKPMTQRELAREKSQGCVK